MTRLAVINCSAPHYNLGAQKMRDWAMTQGWQVAYFDGDPGLLLPPSDIVALSVIFSWHATIAREIALRVRGNADVWCGGPGMTALAKWWTQETGLSIHRGLDARFERQRGDYKMTFASRGCPVGCWFCIVPKLEGVSFTLDPDFQLAPVLCDNNLSALPADFQDHIIARYRASDVPLLDANSGFEPRTFDEDCYRRWKPTLRGPWRFAFDTMDEEPQVRAMMRLLRDEPASRKRVYVLVGNEPFAACYDRAMSVIEWGGEPFCQYVLPLNWLGDDRALRPRHDWTVQAGRDFCRYFNRWLWRSLPLADYRPRKGEPTPFMVAPGHVVTPRVHAELEVL